MRPRILLSVGTYDWSFHHIAKQASRRLADRFDFTVKVLREVAPREPYDLTVSFIWIEAERLRVRLGEEARSMACLFDHISWSKAEGRKIFERTMRNCTGVVAGSRALADIARELGAKQAAVCQDGVDLELFRPLPAAPAFTVGWCGSPSTGGGVKGVELIREAAARAGAPLVLQTFEERVPQAEMPERFYSRISAYVCASAAEGTPNPVLEALACGRPVISTRVGIVDQVLQPGENGLFVERSVDAIAAAISEVRTWSDRSARCRSAVTPHGWDVAAARWGDAFDAALAAPHNFHVAAQQSPV